MRRPFVLVLPILACAACPRSRSAPPGDLGEVGTVASVSISTSVASAQPSASAVPPAEPVSIDVVLAGDAIPQVKVLANKVADIMAGAPSCWAKADARVLNLEAPLGERAGLPGDRQILAYAAPPSWFGELHAATKASAYVVANNHACDLGPTGLAATLAEAAKAGVPTAGAGEDPWTRVDLVERGGHHVCLVAWTTFVNDEQLKGRKQRECIEGAPPTHPARVARAELGRAGVDLVHRMLGDPERWKGCDARIVFFHGGREYKAQVRPVLDQAMAAAPYVDAVIISHPHVPDAVEVLEAPPPRPGLETGGRAAGRSVPVFKSLGNFISNQGIAWTPGMSVDLVETGGAPDPIRTIWTRVAMMARLRFGWSAGVAPGAPPSSVKYGYSLAFTEREPVLSIRLRPLPSGPTDPIASRLRKAHKPFGELLDGACRLDPEAPPTCDALSRSPPESPAPSPSASTSASAAPVASAP